MLPPVKRMTIPPLTGALKATLLSLALTLSAPAQPLPVIQPEAAGFAPDRLERLHRFLQGHVDAGRHSGAISMIVRDGHIVDWQTFGHRDLEAGLPMERDTIVRIYSMTKIVTSVAVMMLFEEGRLRLEDPVTNWIPELSNLQVMRGGTVENPELEPARSPVTIKQLLTHTSGFGYDFGTRPLDLLYRQADLWNTPDFPEFIRRVARLPLAHQPGTAWTYGINTDILGYVVQLVSGQDFAGFLEARIFRPLGMVDTDFLVPESKRGRLARIYELDEQNRLRRATPILDSYRGPGDGWPGGGAGLFSTIGDYARFAQMLLDGGRLGDTVILGRKTVELMMANHLNHLDRVTHGWSQSDGFGLGGSVRLDLAKGNNLGSVGQFGWEGAASTYCNIDPLERTVFLLFFQHFPFDQHRAFPRFSTLGYQALVD